MLSRSEYDYREEERMREAQDMNQTLQWETFKPDAIDQVRECLENRGDLRDLINDLDLNYDPVISLDNSQINEIVIEAVKGMKCN